MKKTFLLGAVVALLVIAPAARAAFVKIEDFEAYSINQNVSALHGWLANTNTAAGTFPIVADPGNANNKVLAVSNATATSNIRITTPSIANSTTGTLFLRIRTHGAGNMNFSFGMSDVAATNAGSSSGGSFGDFESQFNENDNTNNAHIRDSGAFANMSPVSPLIPDTWYNIWFVINNATDTTTVYMDNTTGPGSSTSAIQNSSGKTSFTFRNGTAANALSTFLIMTDGATGIAYFDEIYIDTAGQNLTNPMNAALDIVTAVNDSIEVGIGGTISFDPTLNDTTTLGSVAPSTLAVISQPTHGTASFDSVQNKLFYRHTGSVAGVDSFQYRVGNGTGPTSTATVNVTINGAMRLANATVNMPSTAPAGGTLQMVDALPGVTFDTAVVVTAVPGNTKSLLLASINGSVWMVPDSTVPNPVKKELFTVKTLSNFTRGRSIYSVVACPDFASSGNIIVNYQGLLDGLPNPISSTPGLGHLTDTDVTGNPVSCTLRVSRFTISPTNLNTILTSTNSTAIAAAEASVLATEYRYINLAEEGLYHSINDCHFGANDGYLYVTFGDEGGQGEPCFNAQTIIKDQFSSMIRIDINRLSTNLEPNPHYAIVTDNGVARFKIPVDNPYVGANPVYNGQPIAAADIPKVRTEIFITGLRNPFKFFMDETNGGTGDIWVGDVGMDSWERVSIMHKGDNSGWSYWEGSHLRPTNVGNPNPIQPPTNLVKFPEYQYPHTQGNNSVMGGILYRDPNPANPVYTGGDSMNGKYLFGDFGSGRIWVLTQSGTPGSPMVTELSTGGLANVVCFYTDPQTGQILILQHNSTGHLMRLIEGAADTSDFPQLLSQTGAFASLQTLEPNPGVVPFTPNLRFWSDGADKSRFLVIKNLTDQITYSQTGNWGFPEGMVLVKHFNMELNKDFPGTNTKRLETRFLVRNSSGVYGVSYKWNDAGTDATLVGPTGNDFDISIQSGGALSGGQVTGGTFATQTWHIPGQSECLTCHNNAAANILSLTTQQINRTGQLGQSSGNMLTLLSQSGYLSNFTDDPNTLPRYYLPTETQVSLEERVRSYLTVNCTYCHRDGGGANQTWGTLGHQTIDQMGVLYGLPISESFHLPEDRYIIPGNTTNSLIFNRIQARGAIGDGTFHGYTQMPPLATNVVDQQDVQLLSDWINTFANVAPTINGSSLSQTTISEDSTIGMALGSVTATDPDSRNNVSDNSNLRYSITSGNPNNIFSIDPITGQVTVNGILNYASNPQFTLQVTASDNFTANPKSATQTVTINLTQGTANVDANHNGIPDVWENTFHLSTGNPALDTDHDGLKDFFEYLSGGNPTTPEQNTAATVHLIAKVNGPPAGCQYQWRCLNGLVLGQHYYAQTSATLGSWHTLATGEYNIVSVVPDGAGYSKITVFVPLSGSAQFFRLSQGP